MKKRRNLFSELQEGFTALQAEREGKLTLRRVSLAAGLPASDMRDVPTRAHTMADLKPLVSGHLAWISGLEASGVAFAAADVFLRMNGFEITAAPDVTYKFLIGLFEAGTFTFARLEPWLRANVRQP